MGSLSLLQGIFPTQGWNPGLLHCRRILYQLSYQEVHSSDQFSLSVMSDALRPHGLQHARLPCPTPTPGACSNSCLSNHLILCHSLLWPAIFPSIRVFSKDLVLCIRWPKYWSFSISLSNEYSGLISFRIDWFDLFAVQGTLKSLLQHHSSCTNLPKSILTLFLCKIFYNFQLYVKEKTPA